MENREEVIKIENIFFNRGDFSLKIDRLDIYKNSINFICGHNGSGKTTLIEEITGVHGYRNYLSNFAAGFSDNFVVESFTIDQMVEFKKSFHKKWNSKIFNKIMKFAKIDTNKKCTQLSSGQSRILNFALTIAPEEKILVLDEPFTGVDYSLRDFAYTLLIDYTEHGTVIFSGHEIEEAWRISDYFTIIEDGKMVFHESKDDIEEKYCIYKTEEEFNHSEVLFSNQFENVRNFIMKNDFDVNLPKGSKNIATFNEIYKIVLRGE